MWTRTANSVTAKILALVGLVALTVAIVASVATTTGASQLTGPEKGVILLEQLIEDYESNGMAPDDPTLLNLVKERERLQEIANGPAPDPPDPERVAEILAYESDTPPAWDSGLLEACEGGLGTPDWPDGTTLRCVSVPQDDGNVIVAWLTDNGTAWISYQIHGGGLKAIWTDIPVWTDLAQAEFEVEGEEMRVVVNGDGNSFDTSIWRELIKRDGETIS